MPQTTPTMSELAAVIRELINCAPSWRDAGGMHGPGGQIQAQERVEAKAEDLLRRLKLSGVE